MANHLTPDELSKEVGIDREEVNLPREDRQNIVRGAASIAGSAPRTALTDFVGRYLEAAARLRGAAFFLGASGCFAEAAATDAFSASIRSTT